MKISTVLAAFFTLTALSTLIMTASVAYADDSMRCNTTLVQRGDTKADVIEKCGDPVYTDSYCEPIAIIGGHPANPAILPSCENVDLWTYHPGYGQFVRHLYFRRGQLYEIKSGRRLP